MDTSTADRMVANLRPPQGQTPPGPPCPVPVRLVARGARAGLEADAKRGRTVTMEEEALHMIAEAIHEADHPGVVAVATFGGGESGLPGVRIEHEDGSKCFLVPDLTGLDSA